MGLILPRHLKSNMRKNTIGNRGRRARFETVCVCVCVSKKIPRDKCSDYYDNDAFNDDIVILSITY